MEPLITSLHSLATNLTKSTTTLRLRAAAALATSLEPAQRKELYDSIGVVDSKVVESHRRNSIGEAVAAAIAKEAQKGKVKLEHAVRTAEKAARDRVAAEMKLLQQQQQRQQQQQTIQKEEERHAILGKIIVDLGYKRIYVAKACDLAAIPIWEKQRAYRHDRAKVMVKDKIKSRHVGLPGVIALHEDDKGKLSIIDGQHRVGMMALMQQQSLPPSKIGFDLDNILVEVFPDKKLSKNKSSFAADVFTDINKAEPIKLVDMPGVATAEDRRVITAAVATLEETYPDMFKTSQRCRAPHVNADNLRDGLFSSDVLRRHDVKCEKELVMWIMERNRELKERLEDGGVMGIGKGLSEKVVGKAKAFDFYLGLESTWLYE